LNILFKSLYKFLLPLVVSSIFLVNETIAETTFELTGGFGQYALDVDSKRGLQVEDESNAFNISVAAYRSSTATTSWGAVFEVSAPSGRDTSLPGSGRMLGFRFADYLSQINENSAYEIYAGFAQFDWLKKANGYYLGANYRYDLFGEKSGLMLDAKYYQDLAYDSPTGDDIVDGFQTTLKYYYQF
jgi:hypothetical protein